jgi:hypothetical protein
VTPGGHTSVPSLSSRPAGPRATSRATSVATAAPAPLATQNGVVLSPHPSHVGRDGLSPRGWSLLQLPGKVLPWPPQAVQHARHITLGDGRRLAV